MTTECITHTRTLGATVLSFASLLQPAQAERALLQMAQCGPGLAKTELFKSSCRVFKSIYFIKNNQTRLFIMARSCFTQPRCGLPGAPPFSLHMGVLRAYAAAQPSMPEDVERVLLSAPGWLTLWASPHPPTRLGGSRDMCTHAPT